jgi:hypothetical protein
MSILDIMTGIGFWLLLPVFAVNFVSMGVLVARWFALWRASGSLPNYDSFESNPIYASNFAWVRVSMVTFAVLFFTLAALKPAVDLMSAWHSTFIR